MTGTGSQTLLRAPAAAAGTLRCCPRLRARLGSAAPGLLSPLRGVNASPGMEQKSRALSGQRADRVIYLGGKAGPRDIVLREKTPASLPTLSQAQTLPRRGETSLHTRSCPGVALWVVFLCRLVFTPQQAPEAVQSTGGFPWVLFFGPARCAGELGSSGLERGEPGRGFPAGRWVAESARAAPGPTCLPCCQEQLPRPDNGGNSN